MVNELNNITSAVGTLAVVGISAKMVDTTSKILLQGTKKTKTKKDKLVKVKW
jgi:hypothetical protein